MLCESVQTYLETAKGTPFFYAIGDEAYKEVLSELKQNGVIVDKLSDFCNKDDKYPDIDDVVDYFCTLDTDYRQNKHVLVGLGEYLALRGSATAEKVLHRLKSTTLGTARVILLLRCVTSQVRELAQEDQRLIDKKRLYIGENAYSDVSVTCVKYTSHKNVAIGIKGLLKRLEDGVSGNVYVKSALNLASSILPVRYINTAFQAVKHVVPDLHLVEAMGTEDQWSQLYQRLGKTQNSLDRLFEQYGFEDDFEERLYEYSAGLEFLNWLFFVFLKQNESKLQNSYLKYVVSQTVRYDELKNNLLTQIIQISRKDPKFRTFYGDRKKLVKNFPKSEVAIFIHANRVDPSESIYRYTDNTKMEREEILDWVAQNGLVDEIATIYPALAQYLNEYVFDCGSMSRELTEYFKQYRYLKVTNHISDEFMELVERNAEQLHYTHLETRNNAILRIPDKEHTFLYWIDALGVEFLPYITESVKKKGLTIHTEITYADLPTITAINRGFYENWSGPMKEKESRLDDIKHKAEGGYLYEPGQAPIHLESELRIIDAAIDRAATELAMHKCKAFVIGSDHGASRLAVIRHQEEKYETDTKGEHSGRCCKTFPDADMPYAISENGYLVLADYGRFKNSRAANVEVHGGATLEEVVVPVITIKLKKQADVTVKLLKADAIYCDRHSGTTLHLYISDVENTSGVSLKIEGKPYTATREDQTHYAVSLRDVKRAKKNIVATVYDGDDLIGTLNFDVKGKMATINNDFDDLF